MLTRRSFFAAAAATAAAAALPARLFSSESIEPRRGDSSDSVARLNSNENAYGPFPSVLALPNPFLDANRYPFGADEQLAQKIAALHHVSADRVLLGCGSTEIIKLAVSAFTSPTKSLVMASPTFEVAAIHAQAVGANVVKIPLTADYSHDLDAMLAAAQNAGLIYICNPNNPTASLTPRRNIEAFLARLPKNANVLIDEAYHDFVPASADYRSFLDAPVHDDRIVVARTFSKIYGLAGLRLGYGVASPQLVSILQQQSQLDSVNIFALRCALASLDDSGAHSVAAARNASDREEFMRQCAARRVTAIPSVANFVMIDTGRPIRPVEDHFKSHNVLVGRPFPPLNNYLRVSLATPPEMSAFWRAWDQLPVQQ